jgi:hypothetical protein
LASAHDEPTLTSKVTSSGRAATRSEKHKIPFVRPTSPPLRHLFFEVHVRIRLNQKLRHLEMPLPRCFEKRCFAILRRAPFVSTWPLHPIRESTACASSFSNS